MRGPFVCVAAALALAACSPTLNWREVRPEGSEAQLLLPCRPASATRSIVLAGQPLRLSMLACDAGDVTWALAHADVGDPARVGPVLEALRRAAAGNVGAAQGDPLPLAVAGATPNPATMRLRLAGRLPDGSAVAEEVAVFAYGSRVYQASALGAQLPAEGTDTFFASLRVGGR